MITYKRSRNISVGIMNWLEDRAIEVRFSTGKEALFPICLSELLLSFNTYCLTTTFRDKYILSKFREPNKYWNSARSQKNRHLIHIAAMS